MKGICLGTLAVLSLSSFVSTFCRITQKLNEYCMCLRQSPHVKLAWEKTKHACLQNKRGGEESVEECIQDESKWNRDAAVTEA